MPITTVTQNVSWGVLTPVVVTRTIDWQLLQQVLVTRCISWELAPDWSIKQHCPVDPFNPQVVFRRVLVDYLVEGGARICWEFDRHFKDPPPYTYQLQVSQSDIATGDDWDNVGPPQLEVFSLIDTTKRMYGKAQTLGYRVLLTTGAGIYVSPVANVLGKLDDHSWLIAREILRKEFLRHRIFSSVDGFLLRARRYGTICPCVDTRTGEITNTDCTDCFGTGFVNGYYPSLPCQFADIAPEKTREFRNLEGMGTERQVTVIGRFLGFPNPLSGDIFVASSSDERYLIHSTIEAAHWRSVPLVFECELRRMPFSHIAYTIPLNGCYGPVSSGEPCASDTNSACGNYFSGDYFP